MVKKKKINLRPYSSIVTDGYERAPSRGMLRAVGFKDLDFNKPQIGIASTWSMVTPCNMHIDKLARDAAAGVASRVPTSRARRAPRRESLCRC